MKHIFILNPAAGKGLAGKNILPQMIEISKELGVDYEIHRTIGTGDAERFVRSRCEELKTASDLDPDTVRFYACGGDGTLNEVVNGVFDYDWAEIAMIPAGTGNDFARNFSDQKGFLDIRRQINGQARKVDVIRYQAVGREKDLESDGAEEESRRVRYCINMFNIGLDANVVTKAADLKKYFMVSGPLAYGLSVGILLARKEGVCLDIEFEDGTIHGGDIMMTAIANGCYCGGGFKGVPLASIDDGLMDVSIVETVTRRRIVSLMSKYRKGTHLSDPDIEEIITYKKCRSLMIRSEDQIKLCTDGEISLANEIKFEIVPKAINFSVPQGCE